MENFTSFGEKFWKSSRKQVKTYFKVFWSYFYSQDKILQFSSFKTNQKVEIRNRPPKILDANVLKMYNL